MFIIEPLARRVGFVAFASESGIALTLFVGFVCSLLGVWLLTTPCPAFSESERATSARMIARTCTGIVSGGTLLVFSLYFFRAGNWVWNAGLLVSPFGLVGLIGAWAVSRYLKSLAEMLNSDFVVRKVKSYFLGFAACWLFLALGVVISYFLMAPPSMCLALTGGLGVLAFGTLLLYSPNYLLAAIEDEIRLSQALDKSLVQESDNP